MAIAVEFFSVIIRKITLEDKYLGGVIQYEKDCPNGSFKEDEDLTRVGFMNDIDLHVYCEGLIEKGMQFDDARHSSDDFVVVQQLQGFQWPVDWLELTNGYVSLKC